MIPRSCALLALLGAFQPATAEGRDLKAFFLERCAVCHGVDGTGRGPGGTRLGGRNLTNGRWLARQQETDLAATILKGRGAMPGFRRQLDASEAQRMVATVLRPLASKEKP